MRIEEGKALRPLWPLASLPPPTGVLPVATAVRFPIPDTMRLTFLTLTSLRLYWRVRYCDGRGGQIDVGVLVNSQIEPTGGNHEQTSWPMPPRRPSPLPSPARGG